MHGSFLDYMLNTSPDYPNPKKYSLFEYCYWCIIEHIEPWLVSIMKKPLTPEAAEQIRGWEMSLVNLSAGIAFSTNPFQYIREAYVKLYMKIAKIVSLAPTLNIQKFKSQHITNKLHMYMVNACFQDQILREMTMISENDCDYEAVKYRLEILYLDLSVEDAVLNFARKHPAIKEDKKSANWPHFLMVSQLIYQENVLRKMLKIESNCPNIKDLEKYMQFIAFVESGVADPVGKWEKKYNEKAVLYG